MVRNMAVFGLYPSREMVIRAVDTLQAAGFRNTDVSALFPESEGAKDFAHEKSTKAPEGATAGGASGAVLCGALGWLAGIGALAVPGLGPLIAAGPIVSALAGVGTGAVAGGIVGALVGFGMPEYEAKQYEGRIRRGGILLSVHCDNAVWTRLAEHILETTGGENVSKSADGGADFTVTDRPRPRHAAGN